LRISLSAARVLNQHVEDLALVVDGTPQIRSLARDLVQMPSLARRWPALPQPLGDQRTKLQHPASHRFVGDLEPTLGKEFFHVAVAQREAPIEPDRVLDDRSRKAMPAIRQRVHASC
jgi:hypothetical protein